jgi:integrase
MPKLTVLQLRQAKEKCRLADGGGLYFEITSSVLKRWLYRFRVGGKGNMFIVGHYPEMSLEEAQSAHRKAKALVKQGINPSQVRRKKREENSNREKTLRNEREQTFEFIALDWIMQQRGGWSKSHADSVMQSLKNNVFEGLGKRNIETITPPDVLEILRRIEERGSLEIARKVLQRMTAVFRYAIQTGRAMYNPAADMQGVLKSKPVTHMPAVFGADLGCLLRDIAASEKIHLTTKLALQFTAHTACRSNEVRGARWSEINLDEREWHIPAERMKMKRHHIVPLSKQAIAILERAGVLFGVDGLVFPSVRDRNKPMSDNAISKALRDMGYKGIATPHGFRASFSSAAYEKSGQPGEVIEKALAHEEKSKIKAAYNRAEYLEQRRALMDWWGRQLQIMEQGGEIVSEGLKFT